MVLLIVVILAIVMWKKRSFEKAEARRMEENKDLNPVYGTYSRGGDGEGDYGDGDVVEMSDRNSMYGY